MKPYWITLLLSLTFLIAACSSQAPPEPISVDIDMTEYAFEPAELEFRVGQEVTLRLSNSGALEHEIMFGRDVMMTDGRPNGYEIDLFENTGVEPVVEVEMSGDSSHEGEVLAEMDEHNEEEQHTNGDEHEEGEEQMEEEHAHSGTMVQLPVSSDVYTMSFTVTEDMLGEWEIGCFLLDGVHYTSGMVGSLMVRE